jgi:Tfp pilus assembly protein PilO
MKSPVRHSSWMVTIPLAVAAVAYVFFVFLPQKRAIGQIREQIKQRQDYIVEAGTRAGAVEAAQEELETTTAYSTAWSQRAPAERGLSATYARIQELAKAAGTAVVRFDPEPVVRYETISLAPLKLGCIGSFAEVCGFLEDLERLPLGIWVTELRLERSRQNEESVQCEITLGIFACNSEDSDYANQSD